MTDKNILMRQKKITALPADFSNAHLPTHGTWEDAVMDILHALWQLEQPLSAGMGSREKSVADRSAQRRSTPQSTNGNGVPHKKARPRHAQGIGVCLPALVRSGSGCRFHRISAVVAKCEGCYSKETQEVRYERLDPFRLAPRFRDVLGKLRHPRRRASGRVHPSVRRTIFRISSNASAISPT